MTPIRRQYLQLKKRYPEAILFFRLGDFYETFDDDAKLVAAELQITLTGRDMGQGERVPMAGVPHHAAEGYVAKLVGKGYKVAICEQMEDPATANGIVQRDVVRVVTPGTIVEPTMLPDRANNYLAAVVIESTSAGLAYVDITTGEFAATQFGGEEGLASLHQELARLAPAECLVPKAAGSGGGVQSNPPTGTDSADALSRLPGRGTITPYEHWHFDLEAGRRSLLDHFEASSLEGFGCAALPLATRAAGALVQYLQETQRASLAQLSALRTYSTDSFMVLDPPTRANLEITQSARSGAVKGSLLWVLDRTKTPMGARLLRQWISQPLLDLPALVSRQEDVAELVANGILRAKLVGMLGKVGDIERLINRVVQGIATPRDLVGLESSLEGIPAVREALAAPEAGPRCSRLAEEMSPCREVVEVVTQAIVPSPPANLSEGGVIAAGFSPELDRLNQDSEEARRWVSGLEGQERRRTGVKSLKVGYNKVFGYYIEVSNANVDAVPAEYIRKQTLVGAERFITPKLKEYETLILNARERMVEIETRIFRQACQQVASGREQVLATARALAQLDVYLSLAEVAVANRYVRPLLSDGDEIRIFAGRHPVVELTIEEQFVPNDVHLSNHEDQLIVLTGPNMAGKSTYLRQVALIVLMAQIGSMVPADQATIGLVDRIFTRVGAQDEIAAGRSTFMVEMTESANILHHATPKSLVVLDEIGRGTSTYDGISIARAVVEYVHNHPKLGCKTLFATHFHELTELAKYLPKVKNYRVDVLEEGDKVVFLRKVVPGGADRSYGIHVARLAGLPRAVVRRADEILKELERTAPTRLRQSMSKPTASESAADGEQLSLFGGRDPVVDELAHLDVSAMSPLEAITKLYELHQKAKNGSKG